MFIQIFVCSRVYNQINETIHLKNFNQQTQLKNIETHFTKKKVGIIIKDIPSESDTSVHTTLMA